MAQQWKHQLVSTLIIVSNLYQIIAQNYNDEIADFERLNIPTDDTYPGGLEKRLSKFVRIGRGLSNFIRIGRQIPEDNLKYYQPGNDPDAVGSDLSDSGNSAFIEYEPDYVDKPAKRLSSFVRIGKSYDTDKELYGENVPVKRAGAFIRMGKFPTSAYLRNRQGRVNGLAPAPYYRRTGRIGHSSFIRIGKRDTSNALRRMLEQNELNAFKSVQQNNDTQPMNTHTENERYLKIGRETDDEENKENDESGYIQDVHGFVPGYGSLDVDSDEADFSEQQKRSHFVRIGKSNMNADKRMSSFVRIGKRTVPILKPRKRNLSSFVRIGKSLNLLDHNADVDTIYDDRQSYPEKRMSSFVRIGKNIGQSSQQDKRMSSFVRIGKSGDDAMGDDIKKRISSFVRIGRNFPGTESDVSKRLSSFIRVGKDLPTENDYDKRFSKFVRIGKDFPSFTDALDKRFSKFVRIGKGTASLDNDFNKRLSSFIRVGKGDIDDNISKRLSSFIRVGKSGMDDDIIKRLSSFIRVGKGGMDDDISKRLSSFIRVGKGGMDDDISKRLSSFIRVGKNGIDDDISKRLSSFIRVGKDGMDDDISKRLSSFIRVGKDGMDDDISKRLSSFIRVGKNGMNDDISKRLSSFIRVGKDNYQQSYPIEYAQEDNNALTNDLDATFLGPLARINRDIQNSQHSTNEEYTERDESALDI